VLAGSPRALAIVPLVRVRRGLLVAGAAVVVAGAAGAAIVVRRAGETSPAVSRTTALKDLRAQTSTAAAPAPEGPPAAGVYDYAVRGTECAGVAGLKLCRALPSRARVVITRSGATLQVELLLSQAHVEAQRFDVRSAGRYLTWQRADITFAGIGQDDRHDVTPPTLALPARLAPGVAWPQAFHVGTLAVTATNAVLRRGTVDIGGRKVPAVLIRSESRTAGAHPGTERDLTWHAPSLGLDLRMQVTRRIGGTFPYTLDADATLLDVTPAR
jgi:hypothetical protein